MGSSDVERLIWQDRDRFYRLAYSYVHNREDALDVVSESIVKALRSQRGLRDREAMRAWFYRIVIHTACDFRRRDRRTVLALEARDPGGQEDRHADADLAGALRSLPEALRAVVILRFFEDLKIQEIAYVLDENLSTIKSRLYRALRMLRLELSEEHAGRHSLAGGNLNE